MKVHAVKAVLICASDKLLDTLGPVIQAGGYEVDRALVRRRGQPLTGLLDKGPAGVALLVVDSGNARPQDDLAALAVLTSADPALQVLMFSPQRDADALLAAMRAGVREVLPSPPEAAEVQAALQRLGKRAPAPRAPAHVIAFMSCKGGSGATFVATNVAWLLAAEHEKRTVLIDLDLQYGDASYFVSDQPAKANLADVTRQIDRLDARLLGASMVAVAPNFSLLAAPDDAEAALAITPQQLGRVLDVAAQGHEYVVLDLERMLDAVAVKALDRAELVFLVLEGMLPHVRDAKRLVRMLRSLGYPDGKLRLVVTREDRRGAISRQQIEAAVGLKVSYGVPDSPGEIAEAVNAGVPLPQLHPHGAAVRALRLIAQGLTGRKSSAARGWIGRLVGEHN
jgi:pilus assembly protein CpaE